MTLQNHVWIKEPFKVQDGPINFELQRKKLIDMFSDSTPQANFKKWCLDSWRESHLQNLLWLPEHRRGWGIIKSTLMGAGSPQDPPGLQILDVVGFHSLWQEPSLFRTCQEVLLLKEKVKKSGEEVPVCGWLVRSVCFQRTRRGRTWCGELGNRCLTKVSEKLKFSAKSNSEHS